MLQVRQPTPDELPFVLNSYSASQSQHYKGPRQAIRAWLRDRMLRALERPTVVVLVAEDEGVALGCLVAEPRRGLEGAPGVWVDVQHLYTKAAFRRAGVATALLGACCAELGEPGSELAYSCRAFPAARRWAERLGAHHMEHNGTHYERASGVHHQRNRGD